MFTVDIWGSIILRTYGFNFFFLDFLYDLLAIFQIKFFGRPGISSAL